MDKADPRAKLEPVAQFVEPDGWKCRLVRFVTLMIVPVVVGNNRS